MADAVTIDTHRLRIAVKRVTGRMRNKTAVNGKIARHMRDYVRTTITLQGRRRPYTPLSRWTKARTRRRKALVRLKPRIKARWSQLEAEVYFDAKSSAWNITMHHRGYRSAAVKSVPKGMAVPKASGGLFAFFQTRKAAVTPAREVWPTKSEINKEAIPIVHEHIKIIMARDWR